MNMQADLHLGCWQRYKRVSCSNDRDYCMNTGAARY